MNATVITAVILFILTYVVVFAWPKYKLPAVLVSAFLFVVIGSAGILPGFSYTVIDAFHEIDFNVLMMIAGTMGTVYLFIESRMPKRIAEIIVSKAGSIMWLVFMLSLFAGVISAFVDNVATVLMVAPVAISICDDLGLSPVSSIICISISSNLQGAATLVGDTTSILLAKAAGLDFMDFFVVDGRPGMFFVTEAGAMVAMIMILLMFRKENGRVILESRTEVEDKVPTALLVLTVFSLIAVSFIPYKDAAAPGQMYKPDITNGLICLFYFAIGITRKCLMDRSTECAKACLKEIDFDTIFLLTGLFIVIGGVSGAGVIELIGKLLAGIGGDGSVLSVFLVYTVIVWVSVLLSAFIDNIPYTATMLPVVAVLAAELSSKGGIAVHPNLFYFGLLVGATLGGNLTPVGASANIAGIGILKKHGYLVSTSRFMRYSVPFTLSAVMVGYLLLWLIWRP